MLKYVMRSLIIGLCLLLGISGYAANYVSAPASLQAQINAAAGGRLIVAAGTYTTSGLTCAGNFTLESDGPVVFNQGSSTIGFDMTNCPAMTLRGDFTFAGSASSYTGYGTGPSDSGQVGVKVYSADRLTIEGKVRIQNINGACLDAQAPTAPWQTVAVVRGLSVTNCYRGVWLHNSAEYMTFTDLNAFNNVIGVQVDSGNNTFLNAKTIYNSIGVKVCGYNNVQCHSTGNNAHGVFVGLESNHNTYNLSIQGVTLGETFSASHFIGDQAGGNAGIIQIIDSKAVNIIGGQIGSSISIDATSQVSIQSNYMRTDLSGFGLTNAGVAFIKNNFTPSGLWTSNN